MAVTMGPTPALLLEIAHSRWEQLATHSQLHVSYVCTCKMHMESTVALGINGCNVMSMGTTAYTQTVVSYMHIYM